MAPDTATLHGLLSWALDELSVANRRAEDRSERLKVLARVCPSGPVFDGLHEEIGRLTVQGVSDAQIAELRVKLAAMGRAA